MENPKIFFLGTDIFDDDGRVYLEENPQKELKKAQKAYQKSKKLFAELLKNPTQKTVEKFQKSSSLKDFYADLHFNDHVFPFVTIPDQDSFRVNMEVLEKRKQEAQRKLASGPTQPDFRRNELRTLEWLEWLETEMIAGAEGTRYRLRDPRTTEILKALVHLRPAAEQIVKAEEEEKNEM